MANQSLMTGAGIAASSFNNLQEGYNKGMAASGPTEIAMASMREQMYKARQDEVELKNYVNGMENIDVSKVEESMRPELNAWLIKNRNEYAAAAKRASKLDADHPDYLTSVNKMNEIDAAFKNASAKFDGFKNKRDQYYEDDRNNSISLAADRENLDAMFKNSEYDIVMKPDGSFVINNGENEYIDYSEFEKDGKYNYFLVNNEGFNGIMNLTNNAQQGATKIEGGLEQNYLYKLNQMFNTMGREDIESMLYDTVISDVPLNKDENFNPELLQVENDNALRKWMSETYLEKLKIVANGAYNQKRAVADQKIQDAANKSRRIAQAKQNVENAGKMSIDLDNITPEQKRIIQDALKKQQTVAAGEVSLPVETTSSTSTSYQR